MIKLHFELPSHFLDSLPQRAGFVLMAMFLGTFLFIRTSARLMRSPKVPWWPGSVKTSGGLHLHHLVWGIVLLMLSGFLRFVTEPASPWAEFLAAAFGIGAGLTLDEFALWIHLRDVYWAEEGRSSFDAVVMAAVIGGLIVLGVAPFDLHNTGAVETLIALVLADVLLSIATIFKGRRILGVTGIFMPLFSFYAVLRLAQPRSPWARRRYPPGSTKLARAQVRWERIDARWRRVLEVIAGAPGQAASSDGPGLVEMFPVAARGKNVEGGSDKPQPPVTGDGRDGVNGRGRPARRPDIAAIGAGRPIAFAEERSLPQSCDALPLPQSRRPGHECDSLERGRTSPSGPSPGDAAGATAVQRPLDPISRAFAVDICRCRGQAQMAVKESVPCSC